jgi:hypothetical protein
MLTSIKRASWIVGACIALCVGVGLLVRTSTPLQLPELLRISETAQGEFLEVPVVTYSRPSDSAVIDFVGAVHLGERAYYDKLNSDFTAYDVVLYELVGDGASVPERHVDQQLSLLGTVQRSLARLLGLTFQLDEIDYKAKNFLHADLSPEQLRAAMSARGESLPQILLKVLKISSDPSLEKSLRAQGFQDADLEGINPLLIMLRGPTPEERRKIKMFMARGLVASDSVLKILEGENGFSIITDRNGAVLSVVQQELADKRRKMAIFYGVGHLPDLHRRLTEELGFSIVKIGWNRAWNLR